MGFPNKTPFTEKELKHDLGFCRRASETTILIGGIIAIIGVISDVANINLGLEPMNWFLLAIVVMLISTSMLVTWAVAAIILGMDEKGKKKK